MTTTNDSTHTLDTRNLILETEPPVDTDTTPPAEPTEVYAEGYARCRAALDALQPKDLLVPNLDILRVVGIALNACPRLLAMRDVIHAAAPQFDMSNIDRLQDYAYAAGMSHAVWANAMQPPKDLARTYARAIAVRDMLYSDASALAVRGLIPAESLKAFKTKVGYAAVAGDLLGLAAMMRAVWPRIRGRCAIVERDLAEAHTLAAQINVGTTARNESPKVLAELAIERQRGFTLFVNAYEQVRRVVTFVRWEEDDAEKIAPSLYGNRGSASRNKKSGAAEGGSSDSTVPTEAPVTTRATGSSPPPPTAMPAVIVPGSGLSSSTAVGMPGSNPFGT